MTKKSILSLVILLAVAVSSSNGATFKCPDSLGVYRPEGPGDQGRYYLCVNYVPFPQKCPEQMVFDRRFKQCKLQKTYELREKDDDDDDDKKGSKRPMGSTARPRTTSRLRTTKWGPSKWASTTRRLSIRTTNKRPKTTKKALKTTKRPKTTKKVQKTTKRPKPTKGPKTTKRPKTTKKGSKTTKRATTSKGHKTTKRSKTTSRPRSTTKRSATSKRPKSTSQRPKSTSRSPQGSSSSRRPILSTSRPSTRLPLTRLSTSAKTTTSN